MSALQERITQFRKMASDDPDNELGHFRLGQLLLEDGQHDEAVQAFRRTLELSPQFSKVYQLLGTALVQLGRKDEAIQALQQGFAVADERGDNMPRDEMGRLLGQLGQPVPQTRQAAAALPGGGGDGFRCQRPGCPYGGRARRLGGPPMSDQVGQLIHERICADCWNLWLRDLSVKVINELRLDLSREDHQKAYDDNMKQFFGFED